MHDYHHVKTLLLFFVYGWLSKITCQFAPAPYGLDNFLFGGLGAFPPPPPPPIGSPPIGIENLFGQAQFAPGMPPMGGSYPMGPLPFPLFPMPCDVMCDHGGLFFTNIAISNPQQVRPGGAAGMPGGAAGMPGGAPGMPGGAAGMPGGAAGMPGGGGMPGAGGAGMMTTMRPGGAAGAAGGAAGAAGGAAGAGARPGAGAPGGAGATPTRPPGGAAIPTTMPTRLPTPGGGAAGMMAPQNPNVNVQIMSFYPNWCTGWCRFFYRPRPMMPPPPPPPPPLPLPHPACFLFAWLGL